MALLHDTTIEIFASLLTTNCECCRVFLLVLLYSRHLLLDKVMNKLFTFSQ